MSSGRHEVAAGATATEAARNDGSPSRIVEEPGMGSLEVFALDTSEEALVALLRDVFENYWQSIYFGPLIQGAAWEIKAPGPPRKVGLYDGYLTVDFGPWHFHLCIGDHRGSAGNPVDPELASHRRTARAELYRQLTDDGTANSWALRLYNGRDEQQITVFLPSPFLSDELRPLSSPDWARLAMWDHLRKTYLNLEPDPRDRTGTGFVHG